jgi:hypothetical protein
MELKEEIWECTKCGSPCRVSISYSDDKLPAHLKGNERFRRRGCPCAQDTPEWRKKTD